MKKALVLLLALSMVFGAFADEPVANVNVSEFSGEASVTWGVDLDESRTGFKNDAKVTLKLNLIDGGDKSSTGEGVWGEIKIKTDGDTFDKVEGNDVAFGTVNLPAKVKVDVAKLHFGDNAYIGIKSGDTQVGEYKLDTAVAAEKTKNGNVGDGDYKNGIVAGYGNDMFSVDVDFRSANIKTKDATYVTVAMIVDSANGIYIGSNGVIYTADKNLAVGAEITKTKDGNVTKYAAKDSEASQYSNMYSFAIDGSLKAVENLTLKGGYSADFANKQDELLETGFYVASDYKLGLNDTFYLKPQVGYAHKMNNGDFKYNGFTFVDAKLNSGNLVAAVLFGWGDKADSKPGVYFLDNDDDKKVIPGFSVAIDKQVVANVDGKVSGNDVEIKGKKSPTALKVSFFSGEIVENLTAAAYYETKFGDLEYKQNDSSVKVETNPGFAFAAGLKYKLAVGEGSITPQFGIAMLGGYYEAPSQIAFVGDKYKGEILNLQAGVEFGGYVENTTFSIDYASKNLKDGTKDAATAGTLNFKCKIAL